MAYPLELRRVVLGMCVLGVRVVDVAASAQVSKSWLYDLRKQQRETGQIASKPCGGDYSSRFTGASLEGLKGLVEAHPDATLHELCDLSEKELGVSCGTSVMGRTVKKLGFTFKKSRSAPASRTARMSRVSV